jgi:hypothetical protein
VAYNFEAVKRCRKYYIKFNGDAAKIEKAMRQNWSTWSRENLYDRGQGRELRIGWINKYGFERSLLEALNLRINAVQSDDQRRYEAVVKLGDEYQEKSLQGQEKAVPIFLKLTDQQIALRTKLDLGAANFEAFIEAFELIVKWSKEINIKLAKEFYKDREEFIRRARLKYGAKQEQK